MTEQQYRDGICRMIGRIRSKRILAIIYNFINRYYSAEAS